MTLNYTSAPGDVTVDSPAGTLQVARFSSPGDVVIDSPAATLSVEARYGDIDASISLTFLSSGVLRALLPTAAASEGETKPIEVQIWDPLNSQMLAIADGRRSPRWLDDLNDSGSGGIDLLRYDPKATDANMATSNIVKFVYAGLVRFAYRIESRKVRVVGQGDKAEQVWELTGRGVLALLSDARLYPEYGINQFTRKQRSFFFGSLEGPWYVASEWFTPRGMKVKSVPSDHPWKGLPEGWPDKDAQWIWSTNPNNVSDAQTNWFRSYFTIDTEQTIRVMASADDQCTVYLDGFPILATVQGEKHSFRKFAQFDVRVLPGQHLLAAEVVNAQQEIEEVTPTVETNEISPSAATSGNMPYIGRGYTDGGYAYVNGDGSFDGGGTTSAAFDNNNGTYWLSVGNYSGWSSAYEYVEGTFARRKVTAVKVRVYGGPYTVYISLKDGGGGWNGSSKIPYRSRTVDANADIRYVRKVYIPANGEKVINVPDQMATRVRVTGHATWNSGLGQFRWRFGVRKVRVTSESREGSYVRGGNFAGFLCTIASTDDAGNINGTVHRSEPSGWLVKKEPRPGWLPAHILLKIIDEARAREVLGIMPLQIGFTANADSYGVPWDMERKDVAYGIGDDYLSIAKKLAEDSEMDIWIDPDSLTLHAAPKKGQDLATGADVVVLRPGQSLSDFTVDSGRPTGTRLIVETEFGWLEVGDFASEYYYGRIENFVSLGNALSLDEAKETAENELETYAVETYDSTIVHTDLVGPRPYVTYENGDVVLSPTGVGTEYAPNRVLSIRVAEGNAGQLSITVEVDRQVDQDDLI